MHFPLLSWVLRSVFINLAHALLLLSQSPDPPLEIFVSVLELALQLLDPELQLLFSLAVRGRLSNALGSLDQLGHCIGILGFECFLEQPALLLQVLHLESFVLRPFKTRFQVADFLLLRLDFLSLVCKQRLVLSEPRHLVTQLLDLVFEMVSLPDEIVLQLLDFRILLLDQELSLVQLLFNLALLVPHFLALLLQLLLLQVPVALQVVVLCP